MKYSVWIPTQVGTTDGHDIMKPMTLVIQVEAEDHREAMERVQSKVQEIADVLE